MAENVSFSFSVFSLLLFLCIFLRITTFFLFFPLFPKEAVTRYARIALSFFLSFILTLTLQDKIQFVPVFDISLFILILQEIAVGMVMGFVVMIFEQILLSVGTFISHLMGLDMAEVFMPGTSHHSSLLSSFCFYLGIMILLMMDAHHFLINALALSVEAIPPGTFTLSPELFHLVFQEWTEFYRFLILIPGPFLLFFTVIIVELGILGKMVPQMNIYLMEYPVRLSCAIVLLAWFLPSYIEGIKILFFLLQDVIETLLS